MRKILGLLLLLPATLPAATPPGPSAAALIQAADAFIATLGPEERKIALFPFEAEERFNWHFTAKPREGLTYKQMTEPQRKASVSLLRAAISERGYEKAETIRSLEDVLYELENHSPRRDRERYYFSVFGQPSDKGVWGFRYEGHHVSFNFTMIDGIVRSSTPQFLGANPAEVRDGPKKGLRALPQEEDLARALLGSLTDAQKKTAIVGTDAPAEIVTGPSRTASRIEDVGIAWPALDPKQQAQLVGLIEEHAAAQKSELAQERLAKIRAAGLEKVKFAWIGSAEKGAAHYYRIQGPTFLIEYDNTQNNANHVHTVWRDFDGDWGADLLAEHYRTQKH
jgi:hypothetical protein